jgi:predicted ribosomally synthesized peptide with nif11-like leader
MSIESAKHFYLRMLSDKEFVADLERAGSVDRRLAVAEAQGFSFTRDEMEQAWGDLENAKTVEDFLGSDADVQGFTLPATLPTLGAGVPIPWYAPAPFYRP